MGPEVCRVDLYSLGYRDFLNIVSVSLCSPSRNARSASQRGIIRPTVAGLVVEGLSDRDLRVRVSGLF